MAAHAWAGYTPSAPRKAFVLETDRRVKISYPAIWQSTPQSSSHLATALGECQNLAGEQD